MSTPVIQVKNIGKKYKLGATLSHNTLRDHLAHGAKSLWHRICGNSHLNDAKKLNRSSSSNAADEFWALKDISFDVKQGEVVGIIGRNGAGKSTLLKILTQITEPTEGEVYMKGRVSSLLEVGTGFHPELTGRENIFLNGAILGMPRAEIKKKFDEIVTFAEIEKFIDTPVKRYSSGMYVRLAFAVAAHLEPELLLVDEVLAVGDVSFQKKCLGRMSNVAKEGRTVLFVSHNMGAIRQLCSKAIFVDHGRIVDKGEVGSIIDQYLKGISANDSETAKASSSKYLRAIKFIDSASQPVDSILAGAGGVFRIYYDVGDDILTNVCVTIAIYDLFGIKAAMLTTQHAYEKASIEEISGEGYIDCRLGEIPLTPGQYQVNIAFDGYSGRRVFHDGIVNGCQLTVIPSDYLGPNRMKVKEDGFVLIKQQWVVK